MTTNDEEFDTYRCAGKSEHGGCLDETRDPARSGGAG